MRAVVHRVGAARLLSRLEEVEVWEDDGSLPVAGPLVGEPNLDLLGGEAQLKSEGPLARSVWVGIQHKGLHQLILLITGEVAACGEEQARHHAMHCCSWVQHTCGQGGKRGTTQALVRSATLRAVCSPRRKMQVHSHYANC